MEIEGEDGSKTHLKEDSKIDFGRGLGFQSKDNTVSRRQISLHFQNQTDPNSGPRVSIEVIGKNPIWVLDGGSGEIRVLRRHEKAQIGAGDRFSVSVKKPIWFNLKNLNLESVFDFGEVEDSRVDESLDVSHIDPVKEFGFLVMGHEFDHYPKKMIRDIKNWNWFLEEPKNDTDTDTDDVEASKGKARKGSRGKRKKGEDNVDEEWTGESDSDKELVSKLGKGRKSNYPSTRLKDRNKPKKGSKSTRKTEATREDDDEDEESENEEDDDTLGGFIVNDDEDMEEAEVENDDEEDDEEEEFDEDEDEDED